MSQTEFDHTKNPRGNLEFYAHCADRLETAGVKVERFRLDVDHLDNWLAENSELVRHYQASGAARTEKCLEHYLTANFCDLKLGMTVIDVAAGSSPWAGLLRQQSMEAFRLDLSYPPGVRHADIGADATDTSLPDGFTDAMLLHCAYECFQGDADVRLISEATRLLTPGGTLAVTPLYIDDIHFVLTHPECPLAKGAIEPEAKVLVRDDPWKVPFSRHYSPESFTRRVFSALPECMDGRVVYIENMEDAMDRWADQLLYAFFTFVAQKATP